MHTLLFAEVIHNDAFFKFVKYNPSVCLFKYTYKKRNWLEILMPFSSSTQSIPTINNQQNSPQHLAIVMDGNGRWAKKRLLPRIAGHKQGVEAVRKMIQACLKYNIRYLTLFAFSSENWRRPAEEVSLLMDLFLSALRREIHTLHKNNICFRVIGDITAFNSKLQTLIRESEALTKENTALTLSIAANYGGRWDILNAFRTLACQPDMTLERLQHLTEAEFKQALSLAYAPEPDLFIRTGGEQRTSNFLLWQLAYTEYYFTETLWPDFDEQALLTAIHSYQQRERRFGRTSEQLQT